MGYMEKLEYMVSDKHTFKIVVGYFSNYHRRQLPLISRSIDLIMRINISVKKHIKVLSNLLLWS